MIKFHRKWMFGGICCLLNCLAHNLSWANYPVKNISMEIAFAPGGASDISGRILATALSKQLGQQIIVENRPGGGGAIAANYVKSSKPPNGYTLLFTSSVYVVTPSLVNPSPYDPLKDFVPICEVGVAPNVIVVRADSKIKTVGDLIKLAKSDGTLISFGSPGAGTTPHLAGEVIKTRENINMTHIPYKGAGPAMIDLMGGRTQILVGSLASVMAEIQSGQVRAIVQTGTSRWPELSNVPTTAEAGIKDAVSVTFQAVFVAAGTPQDIVSQLSNECTAVLKQPEMIDKLKKIGIEVTAYDSEGLKARVSREVPMWREVIEKAGIKEQQ
jgi:tripartite-type tricarboxylate transporter receptor subunit TctC